MSDDPSVGVDPTEQRSAVRQRYSDKATTDSGCCSDTSSCCETTAAGDGPTTLGYGETDLDRVPEGAKLSLGCGNPMAIDRLEPGETVLDLGSGAGFDCFLAADEVGETGQVIGVDMTPDMLERARQTATEEEYPNAPTAR